MTMEYVIGVDYGTDSVRTIILNAHNGDEVASSVFDYPRWKAGLYCDITKNQYRQHPLDYIEGLELTIKNCLQQVDKDVAENVVAISIDTTGSTPVAVNESGIPLALLPEFGENPNAMFVLWKDHTAIKEAEEINIQSKEHHVDYVKYSGGIYSSEWFWAKLLHILRTDEAVKNNCFTWVEHSDWMPFILTGGTDALKIKRNVCAAGHKGLWAKEHGGFPNDIFFTAIDPLLSGMVKTMDNVVHTADQSAGNLCKEWAEKFGLSTNVKIGVGILDAHVGAIGGQIEDGYLSKVIGTSTCDMMVVPKKIIEGKLIKGISGQVHGSIIPGMIGLEAGQAAFGDIYAWFKNLLSWPLSLLADDKLKEELSDKILAKLNDEASKIVLNENAELAIDWMNGRRTPDVNPLVKGAISGLTLASDAPRIYRALVEATCFGSKKIIERLIEEGVKIKGVIGLGGIAKKSPFVMQMLADVLEMPIKIHSSAQTCASGACMFAATVAGVHDTIETAMMQMGKGFDEVYYPNENNSNILRRRYKQYINTCNFIETQH